MKQKNSNRILNERKRKEKGMRQRRKAVHYVNTGSKSRWIGWRDSEKPGPVTTYKLDEVKNNEHE